MSHEEQKSAPEQPLSPELTEKEQKTGAPAQETKAPETAARKETPTDSTAGDGAQTENDPLLYKKRKKQAAYQKSRKFLKWYFIVPVCLLVLIGLLFLIWLIRPARTLQVAVLDKTVPATAADSHSYLGDVTNNYRKHSGLSWILNHEKLRQSDGKEYDYHTDYYGPQIDSNNQILSNRSLTELSMVPDLLYLADTYGTELQSDRGLSADEMNTVSMCHSAGSVIVGEQDLFTTGTKEDVNNQLSALFGLKQTGWVGRYIYDLADLTDVPVWAPNMYKKKYGQEWRLAGPGILLVSGDGDIIVLEEKTDFDSSSLMTISVNEEYKKEFGNSKVNYYNWFALIQPDADTEVLASYTFHVNATGAEEFAAVSDKLTFAAVTRKTEKDLAPAYYFAGDFNDFITKQPLHSFLGADLLYRVLSADKEGDISHFYWSFYEPMMKKILAETKSIATEQDGEKGSQISRIEDGKLQIRSGDSWKDFSLNGFNINAQLPGSVTASREYGSYVTLLQALADTGGNTVRAYDLLPPEFYRALYEYNQTEKSKIYLIQGIQTPSNVSPSDSFTEIAKISDNITDTMKAVHGGGSVPAAGDRSGGDYRYDLSPYVLAWVIDPRLSAAELDALVEKNTNAAYTGTYFSASGNAAEVLTARLCELTLQIQRKNYGYSVPVSICYDATRLTGASWVDARSNSFNPSDITVSDEAKPLFFLSCSLNTDDTALLENERLYTAYTDEGGSYPFGGYIKAVRSLYHAPVLLDRAGLSTNTDLFEGNASVNGLSEKEQGNGLVRMLRAAKAENYLGLLIADLNDNWCGASAEIAPYLLPLTSNPLWQNTADRAQTSGLVAVESKTPAQVSMELNDSGKMQQMQLSYNETYLYITVLLREEMDYDANELIIGIDTYQRNNGEYYYDKNYYANSLSGMEYRIKFESKTAASLYVASSYNRSKGNVASAESYTAAYDLVSTLRYGDFTTCGNEFYQTGLVVHIRIPWALLNFTDPTNRLVLSGTNENGFATIATDGLLFSLTICNKSDKDTAYIFPESKQSAGYKTLKLSKWDSSAVSYTLRTKESGTILKRYFSSLTD